MRYFLCFILPPAAVLTTGRIGSFILCIILTICGWVPGVIYAILVTSDFYDARRNRRVVRAIRSNRYY